MIVAINRKKYDELCSRVRHLNTLYKSIQKRSYAADVLTKELATEIELKHKEIKDKIEGLESVLINLRITEKKKITIDRRDLAIKIAFEFLGKPYVWGGDDPIKGFDCSGLVIEILKSVGALPRKGDWTANNLYVRFKAQGKQIGIPYAGCLIFWLNNDGKAIHVEICINEKLSIGASGGGSKTKTTANAIRQNAYIKIRPFESRPGSVVFVDPFLDHL